MSKKMLKRSLALGALMAFVITGSAMANDSFNENELYNVEQTGTGTLTITGTNSGGIMNGDQAAKAIDGNTTISGYDKIVLAGDWKNYNSAGNANDRNIFYANNGILTINNLKEIKYTDFEYQEHGGYIWGSIVFHANNGTIVLNSDVIHLEGFCNGFFAQNNASMTVNASEIILKSNDTQGSAIGVQTFTGDTNDGNPPINITTNNLYIETPKTSAISVKNGSYLGSEGESTSGSVNIDATGKIDIVAKRGVNVSKGVDAEHKATVDISANDELKIKSTEASIKADTYGSVTVDAPTVELTNNSGAVAVHAINGSDVSVTGNTIKITAEGTDADITAVKADNKNTDAAKAAQSVINIGTEETTSIEITAKSTNGEAQGIWARRDGESAPKASIVNVQGNNLTINVEGKARAASGGYYVPVGVWAACNTTDLSEGNESKINIDTANTTIDVKDTSGKNKAVAIMAQSKGIVNLNSGNIYATADGGNGDVISVRGKAVVNVNANASQANNVVLNGNIVFDYDKATSGSEIDATVNVHLNNEESSFTGKIYKYGTPTLPEGEKAVVTGMTIALSNGAIWNLTDASIANTVDFGANSVLNLVDGNKYTGADYALTAADEDVKSLTVAPKAKLQIGGIKENVTYNIAKDFGVDVTVGENWTIDNNLMTGEWKKATDIEDGLQVTTVAKKTDEIAKDMGVDSGTASALGSIIEAANSDVAPNTPEAQNVKAFANAIADASPEVAAAAAEAVIKMAEAGGNSATAASIVKNVTGVTNDRLSFNCGHSAPHKGGHGVGLFGEGSGADIWAEYVHGKDKVEDMKSTAGATSYEGQYNGFVMGVDFKKVNKFQSGIAFNYGEGDTNTVGSAVRTRSDYDFWGVGYYGNIHNDDSNVIFDINYAQTDSEVTQKNITGDLEASPETTTWSAGVKLEKLYQNENVQIVPYTGLRYMSIDPDDYATKCGTYKYSMDRQDIWLLPVGVSIRQEIANDNGWTVSPRVDLSYIWAFGDTDSNMEFATALNTKTNIGYDVMDDGSFLGLVGIEAHKGQWGYGVAYSYQKGDHSESKKWYVDVNYSF